ncbi:TonB-dependent receptor [Pedobacter sp.]|uniref:SusC/RagA family TonB-linked outer membrane protein n=1 Tax=Pedobacter sp. TaxID=1411316 RepID=UPI0031CEFB4D
MKKLLQSLFILLLVATTAMAQNRTITGTVISKEDGQPIPGVSVKVKGTNIGVSTGANGKYSLSVPSTATALEISSIGFVKQTITIGSSNVVNASLENDAQSLGEVMVIGYGTTKKESYTGSATVLGSKTFEARPNTSFQKSLQGAAAGVQVTSVSGQPGAATQVRIRGIGSINASASPLYVIDGVAISSSGTDLTSVAQTADILSSLNPNDIESTTILKDASASSIYGSRGANGVIIITTKQGRAGQTKFTASVTGGLSSQAVKKHDVLSAEEYYRVYFNSYYATAIAGGATPAAATVTANNNAINKLTQTSASTGTQRLNNPFNTLQPFASDGSLAAGTSLIYDTDWRSEVLRQGVTKDVNVAASGGSEKLKFYVSGGYFDQKGIVIGSDYKRFTGKFNLSNNVTDFFSYGVNNIMSNSTQNTPAGAGGGANPVRFADLASNIYSLYERDVNGNIKYDATGKAIYSYINPVSPDFNPVGLNELNQYITKSTRINSSPYAQVKFLKDFTAKSMVSLDYTAIRENQFYNMLHGDGVSVKGRGYRYAKEDITVTYINTLNYDKTFGRHTINVLLGQEAFKNKFDNITAMATSFAFPGQTELVSASTPGTASSSYTEERMASYFSRLNYEYDGKYFFSGSLRRDGSTTFGAGNKYGTFYSLGAAWRISQESFLKDVKFINELKLRGSYGIQGNNSIGRYAWQGLYSLGNSYDGQPGMAYSTLENANLQWEKNKTSEIGLEFSILDRRIGGELAFYKRGTDGLLFSKPLSRLTGFGTLSSNLAALENKGVELTLTGNPYRGTDFSWDISFNITRNRNKITKLTQQQVANGTQMFEVGKDRYQWYLREYAGIDPTDGRAMWYMDDTNGNKVTTKTYASAKVYTGLGTSLPDYTGGFNNQLRYKEFDFSIFTYFSIGGKVYDALYQALTHNGINPGQQMSRDVLNAWSASNTSSTTPRFMPVNTDLSNSTSSRYLFSGTYMRVKNITLGYTLKKEYAAKAKLSNVRLFVMAENPFTFARHKGIDPEFAVNGQSDNDIPNIKTFSAGLSVGF